MIEQLSEHGVEPGDLTPPLMQNSRVKNPVAEDSSSGQPSIASPGAEQVSWESRSSSNVDLSESIDSPPPPYQEHEGDMRWVVKHLQTQLTKVFIEQIQEIVLGFTCNHPAILPILGFHINQEEGRYNIYLKMPRMHENLREHIGKRVANNKEFSEKEIVQYLYTLAGAIEYLQS